MLSVSVSTSGPVPPIQYRMSLISDPFGPNDFIVYPEITYRVLESTPGSRTRPTVKSNV